MWSFQEILLYITAVKNIPNSLINLFSGMLFGTTFGILILIKRSFFWSNKQKFRSGIIYGAIFGFAGGLVSFYLTAQIISQTEVVASNPYLSGVLYSLRWLVIALFIGIAIGLRDHNQQMLIRGLIGSVVAGLLGGIAITSIGMVFTAPFWSRGIGFIVFTTLVTISLLYFSTFGRKEWLKALNGKLEGLDFELFQDVHYFGTQSNDDINLNSYQNVRPTHAKLIKYYSGYSLVDNDPFWQTYVNFRNIKEQPLKNGDILKIGKALFQYCAVE